MAAEAIYKFLETENRPFSLNDIAQNVSKEYGKSELQKSLDKLVKKNKIFEKVYGKQKIYCICQSSNDSVGNMEPELKEMDRKICTLSNQVQESEQKLNKCTAELTTLKNELSLEEATSKRNTLKHEVDKMKEALEKLSKNATPISEKKKTEITNAHSKYVKEYKKRKRICMEGISLIMENYPKTKKHLLEDIGIETDEDVNFQL